MNKNDDIILEITDITGGGDGVGHNDDGRVVFVPNTAIGDIVEAHIIKVKPKYALAKVKSVVTPSPDRIASDCPVSSRCGGCVFRHITYSKECEIKHSQVKNSFKRLAGLDITPKPLVAPQKTNHYRNKAQYPVALDREGNVKCGFYTKSSHRVVPVTECKLQPPVFTKIVSEFCSWANKNKISVYDEKTARGLLRHLYIRFGTVTEEIMVTVVINGKQLPQHDVLVKALLMATEGKLKSFQININTEKTNVVLSTDCRVLFGEPFIHDILCGVKIRLSPLSFYQVNQPMAERLYGLAAKLAEPQDKFILDLYCGAGTIGLSMARQARQIIGVEIVPEAIEDAKHNAEINGITNTEFICADALAAAQQLKARNIHPDVVIIDPPRKGCDSELLKIVANEFSPERVVYVSCNDSTLARDCALLKDFGYETKEATPVDMFPRTGHVECAALLKRHGEYI